MVWFVINDSEAELIEKIFILDILEGVGYERGKIKLTSNVVERVAHSAIYQLR